MKLQIFCWFFLAVAVSAAADAPALRSPDKDVVKLATALEHLTVIEFGEPVVMVAAGGSSFQIERQGDKVFIKPLESGRSTDLIVWTASRRFIYELDAPGEVSDMNFVLDNRLPPTPPPAAEAVREASADAAFAGALLAAHPIDSGSIGDRRRGITVRVEHVLLSKNRIYLHYSIRNSGKHPYRLQTPIVERLLAAGASRRETQLDEHSLNLPDATAVVELEVTSVHAPVAELPPRQKTECVIALDRVPDSSVLELNFAPDRGRRVRAIVAL